VLQNDTIGSWYIRKGRSRKDKMLSLVELQTPFTSSSMVELPRAGGRDLVFVSCRRKSGVQGVVGCPTT